MRPIRSTEGAPKAALAAIASALEEEGRRGGLADHGLCVAPFFSGYGGQGPGRRLDDALSCSDWDLRW